MDLTKFPKVTIILRGYEYNQVRTVMEALEGQEEQYALEITLNSPDVFETIRKTTEEYGDRFLIGAGTVLNLEDARKAVDAGATFILSPVVLSEEVISFCKNKGVLTVPAAMTPSEVHSLKEAGADIIKIFPATSVDISHFNALMGPLGVTPFMAVGGVNQDNANTFLENGAQFVGIGSGIFEKEDIRACNVNNLKKSLAAFHEKLSS